MRKTITSLAFAIAILFAQQAKAQKEKPGKNFSGGFGIEAGLISGDEAFKSVFNSEFGLSGRFEFKAGPGWITLTPGGGVVIPKSFNEDDEDISVGTHYFVKAGYKYIFLKKMFVMGEVGYGSYTIYNANNNSEDVTKSTSGGLCFAPTIGANFGVFELGLSYENTKVTDGSVGKLGLRLGWNF
ncbi:MAG: hypothetical protein JST21_13025 [Bacteroidetes bacterium]|nr:hypothetical protein [Bacteroidota bacterium]